VVGGGFGLAGGADATQRVASSTPSDLYTEYGDPDSQLDDFWRIGATASVGTTLTTYAICAKWDGMKQKRIEVPDSPTGSRKNVVKCGNGKTISGGGGSIGSSNSYTSSMFPKRASRWERRVFDGVGGIGGMANYVVCVPEKDFVITKVKENVNGGVSSDVVVAECPDGRGVVGGGAKTSGPAGTLSLRDSRPVDIGDGDGIPQNGWAARAYNTDPGVQKLTAYAICLA
jgi:hypothetical protein